MWYLCIKQLNPVRVTQPLFSTECMALHPWAAADDVPPLGFTEDGNSWGPWMLMVVLPGVQELYLLRKGNAM